MQEGSFYVTYSTTQFETYVKTKFQSLIPADLYTDENFDEVIAQLKLHSLVPRVTCEGNADRRYSLGMDNLQAARAIPAGAELVSAPSKYDEITTELPEALNLETSFSETEVENYEKFQFELLQQHRHLDCDIRGWLLRKTADGTNCKVDDEQFIIELDKQSIEVMKICKSAELLKSVPDLRTQSEKRKEIELCFKVFLNRMWLHCESNKDDVMTEDGWKSWKRSASIIGSFAVLYVSLQMFHYKTYGNCCQPDP